MRERVETGTRTVERAGGGTVRDVRGRRAVRGDAERGRAPWPVRPAGRTAAPARLDRVPRPERPVRVGGGPWAEWPVRRGGAPEWPVRPGRAARAEARGLPAPAGVLPGGGGRPVPAAVAATAVRRVAMGVVVVVLAAAAVFGLGLLAEVAAGPTGSAPDTVPAGEPAGPGRGALPAVTGGSLTPVGPVPGQVPVPPAP